jgi:hypothetical protein
LALPAISGVRSAKLFPAGTSVSFENVTDGLLLHLPKQTSTDPLDTVIMLERN